MKPPKEFRRGYKDPKRLKAIHDLPCLVCKEFGLIQKNQTIAHHKKGIGAGKKASDKLTMAICDDHHNNYNPESIHVMPLKKWERKYFTQDQLILMTDLALGLVE